MHVPFNQYISYRLGGLHLNLCDKRYILQDIPEHITNILIIILVSHLLFRCVTNYGIGDVLGKCPGIATKNVIFRNLV
jgi:hypothetical protein